MATSPHPDMQDNIGIMSLMLTKLSAYSAIAMNFSMDYYSLHAMAGNS